MTRRTWTTDAFMAWFDQFAVSAQAATNVRRVARRYGLADVSEDLTHEWYVKVRSTMDNKARRGEPAGEFPDEDAARGYVYRALRYAAQGILGSRIRDWTEVLDDDPALETSDPALVCAVDHIRLDLVRMWRSNPKGRHGCTGARCIPTALASVEIGVGVRTTPESSPAQTGGRSDWQCIVAEAMCLLWPQLRPNGDPRHDQQSRQMMSRCGRCAQEVLVELFTARGFGEGEASDG